MKIIKKLKGFSGSSVFLIEDPDLRIRKIGNINRNIERLRSLSKLEIPTPNILVVEENWYDMEYIPNLDIKNYLIKNSVHFLLDFIILIIERFQKTSKIKDYTKTYEEKLEHIDFKELLFNKEDLIKKLPKMLPSSEYHGDLTLENILYSVTKKNFVLIDPLTSVYDSWVFDLAKLRQDVISYWFIRNENIQLESKLKVIDQELKKFETWDNEYILILMLLRVLPYVENLDRKFIINEANKLWK